MMMQKPIEYWAVLVGMVLWAAARDAEREAIWRRLVKTGASGFLAFGLTPAVAPYLRGSKQQRPWQSWPSAWAFST